MSYVSAIVSRSCHTPLPPFHYLIHALLSLFHWTDTEVGPKACLSKSWLGHRFSARRKSLVGHISPFPPYPMGISQDPVPSACTSLFAFTPRLFALLSSSRQCRTRYGIICLLDREHAHAHKPFCMRWARRPFPGSRRNERLYDRL
jgi:hypothetical protein